MAASTAEIQEQAAKLLEVLGVRMHNGQIVLTSETYDSKANCKRAATKFGKKYGIPVRVAWEEKK